MSQPDPTEFARKVRYSQSPVGVPTALLTCVWMGLWLLWPSAPRSAAVRDAIPDVAYGQAHESPVMSPTLFARPAAAGFQTPVSSPVIWMDASVRDAPGRRGFLNAQRVAVNLDALVPGPAGVTPFLTREEGYRPMITDPPVLSGLRDGRRRVRLECRGTMHARGFSAEIEGGMSNVTGRVAWQVEAYVEVDAEGKPRHVLIERGSGDHRLDGQVLRRLLRGKASPGDSPAGGRVIVSFGR